jgi:ATP-dependent RNA helicase RhlE
MHAQDYVHRIGRTGRAGMQGHAISLVCFEEEEELKAINRLLKRDLPLRIIDGFEPEPNSRPTRPRPHSSSTRSGPGTGPRRPRSPAPRSREASAAAG